MASASLTAYDARGVPLTSFNMREVWYGCFEKDVRVLASPYDESMYTIDLLRSLAFEGPLIVLFRVRRPLQEMDITPHHLRPRAMLIPLKHENTAQGEVFGTAYIVMAYIVMAYKAKSSGLPT